MNILLIVEPDRPDMYNYLAQDKGNDYSLLWYETRKDYHPGDYNFPIAFKNIFFWDEYLTPLALLKKIKPDKIIFFEIIDSRQIALIVTANAANLPTFYLEHGAAGDAKAAISRWAEYNFRSNSLTKAKRLLGSFLKVVKSKTFYYAASGCMNSYQSTLQYVSIPFKTLSVLPNEALAKTIFAERVPKHCIVFNRKNREQFSVYTGLLEKNAILTGVPFFDKYYKSDKAEEDFIVYIDHPYLEQNIFGWTKEFHHMIAHELFEFAQKRQQKLIVKLHPTSNMEVWKTYTYNKDFVSIFQKEDCTQYYLNAKLIMGFSSSLLTAFMCAQKNIVLLGWNPEPGVRGFDFSQYGLCHVSNDPAELASKFDWWVANNLSYKEVKYKEFLYNLNDPFDGNATKRVLEAINTL